MRQQTRTVVLAVMIAAIGCTADRAATEQTNSVAADNQELADLFDQDQADRSRGNEIDWAVVTGRDSLRRERVSALIEAGMVVTSEDYRHAAMVFQHGSDTTAARLAHSLASTAAELDSTNTAAKWLTAAAWDRYRMRLGLPQWYGTQFVKDQPEDPWRLYDIDTTAVTDETRRRMGVRTLAEARAQVEVLNSERDH